jgi:Gti1/Pac2 family transcription factor
MRRWTDGKSWSASRVSGSFLTYKEMEGKRGTGFVTTNPKKPGRGEGKTPDSGRGSDEDQDDQEPEGYKYKVDGLMKQSFSITTSTGQHLHLIAYYSRQPPGAPELPLPSQDPTLRHIVPQKGMYPESSLHELVAGAPVSGQGMPQPSPMGILIPSQVPRATQVFSTHFVKQAAHAWPLSPAPTPPVHPKGWPYILPDSQESPSPQSADPPPQQSYYAPANYAYENVSRAPPHPSPPQHVGAQYSYQYPPPYGTQHQPARQHEAQQYQATAYMRSHAMAVDPRLSSSTTRNPHMQLPAAGPPSAPPPPSYRRTNTPPHRGMSISPPRSSHSDSNSAGPSGNKASLSALLLHPASTSSEPNSANPGSANSAGSSPRTGVSADRTLPSLQQDRFNYEDARALSVLNSKFHI